MPLAGRPLVAWSIAAMQEAAGVVAIVVACPPGHLDAFDGEGLTLVEGGATRAESVANALARVETELVAIHDAARPLVTPELVEGTIATLLADPGADGAIAATPVTDTVKRVSRAPKDASFAIEGTVDRAQLWAAQTPQVFRSEALRRAIAADPGALTAATDEAALVEAAGGRVLIHPSSPGNLKVTAPFDLRLTGLIFAER